jgi:polysaccharide biosynthesis protein PslG
MKLALLVGTAGTALSLAAPVVSQASPYIRYGIEDDAYLSGGASVGERLDTLNQLGVTIVRYTINWREVARHKPKQPLDPNDPAYDWTSVDRVLRGLHARRITVLLTLSGTPAWANGGRAGNVIPKNKYALAAFAGAVATRYPWVHKWEIWNEPNLGVWLEPNSPRLYVQRLLNPAYVVLHNRSRSNRVAGGATSPRPTLDGLSPVAFMRGMRSAHARLDAYSHHPYPISRGERPDGFAPGVCRYCKGIITLANLPLLVEEVRRDFGPKRIWLTEYGYQTNRNRVIGVSRARQADYVSRAALRARQTPYVDVLVQFLIQDEPGSDGWQTGLLDPDGVLKPSFQAFRLPLAQVSRRGLRTTIWGQVRPGSGRRWYRLERYSFERWVPIGPFSLTAPSGSYTRVVRVARGMQLRVVLRDHSVTRALMVR